MSKTWDAPDLPEWITNPSKPVLRIDIREQRNRWAIMFPPLLEWVQAFGVDTNNCFGLTVFPDGDGTVIFDMYALNSDGRRYAVGGKVETHIEARPLTVPVPAEVLRCL